MKDTPFVLTCVALDDEDASLEYIVSLIQQTPTLELKASFNNPHEAIAFLERNPVDIVFLDMQMPEFDTDGIGVIETLGVGRFTYILVTANSENYIRPYAHMLTGYLLKPFSKKRFEDLVAKLILAKSAT